LPVYNNKTTSRNKPVGKYALLYTKIDFETVRQKLNRSWTFILILWVGPAIFSEQGPHIC